MRTLKKTLSLLLAVALVLSLTVVGASAYDNKVDDFDDVEDIGEEYIEAVGVMTGLGIIEGYDDGTFKPATSYTREQAAKIIAYMQLGPAAAEKLACTSAPFTDVAADRWSAGYIAYAKDVGILDGMGDGSFDPAGTLTGFQWAKMLLCAVGYGENGEFTGSEWSINTAKVSQTVKLFEGDLDGMTNGVINREQAVLYAFNTLVDLGIVVYSPSLGDYIYSYNETIFERVTPEGTLGGVVYGLGWYTGIIVDNEAMGNATTVLSPNYSTTATGIVKISADTGLDMMYHAAKIWAVGDTSKTAVYVMDLATVENATCPATKPTLDETIGEGTKNGRLYEVSTIDNSAIGFTDKFVVGFYYAYDDLGVRSNVKETTVVGAEGAVANEDILTDISELNNGDDIIYIKAESETSNGVAYHVFPVSATTGVVTGISNARQTVTLSDGTVLSLSVFKGGFNWTTAAEDLRVGRTFSFILDTHGHIISYTPVLGAAYYTGTIRLSSAHDAWFSDAAYVAQFIDVSTGEVFEVPVTATWVRSASQGVYDAYDEIYGTGTYNPQPIADGQYGAYYIDYVGTTAVSFDEDTHVVDGIYFDPDNVTFIVATGRGSGVSVQSYTGFDALLAAYNRTGAEDTVILNNLVLTCANTAAGNLSASVIFGWDGINSTSGGYLFVPEDIDENDWSWEISNGIETWAYDGAYLNGDEFAQTIVLADDNYYVANGIERGFYSFTIDANGIFTITPLADSAFVYDVNNINMSTTGVRYWLTAGGEEYEITSWNVVDLRAGVAAEEIDPITSIAELVATNFHDYPNYKVQIAFVPGDGIIYVVDEGWLYNATYTLSPELIDAGWRFSSPVGETFEQIDAAYSSQPFANLDGWTLTNVKEGFALDATGAYGSAANPLSFGITVTVTQDGDPVDGGIAEGTMTVTPGTTDQLSFPSGIDLPVLDEYQRDLEVEISGLTIDVTFALGSAGSAVAVSPVETQKITLGDTVTVSVTDAGSLDQTVYYTFTGPYTPTYDLVGSVQGSGVSTDIELMPVCPGTYTLTYWSYAPQS